LVLQRFISTSSASNSLKAFLVLHIRSFALPKIARIMESDFSFESSSFNLQTAFFH
jgi:hypothetical protein